MIKSRIDKDFFFNEEEHKYTDKKGNVLLSSSQLVDTFVPEFDPDGTIVARCAEKAGVSVKEQKQLWKDINIEACDFGSAVHEELEDYVNTGKIKDTPNKNYVEEFKALGLVDNYDCQAELKVCSLDHFLAGTVDLIQFETKKVINIWDFKTNKEIKTFNPFKNSKHKGRMLYPFSYLHDVNLNHYTFQLNIYAYLLEEMGFWVDKLTLLHFNRKKNKMIQYPLKKKTAAVELMLDIWKNNGYSIESMQAYKAKISK